MPHGVLQSAVQNFTYPVKEHDIVIVRETGEVERPLPSDEFQEHDPVAEDVRLLRISEDFPVERYSGAMCPIVPRTAVVTWVSL